MLKLYGGARSRATLVKWYLEELGLDYEFVLLDMESGEHLQAPYTDLNPFGKVPGLADGDFAVWESGAILLYLAEKYGNELNTPEARAIANQWVLFANATLGPGVFVEATRAKEFPRLMAPLNDLLAKQEFMLGSTFSALDVAVGSYLYYIPALLCLDVSEYPAVAGYIESLKARPAFQNTMGSR